MFEPPAQILRSQRNLNVHDTRFRYSRSTEITPPSCGQSGTSGGCWRRRGRRDREAVGRPLGTRIGAGRGHGTDWSRLGQLGHGGSPVVVEREDFVEIGDFEDAL